jgi:hypothetical protein
MQSLLTFRAGAVMLALANVACGLAGCASTPPPEAQDAPSRHVNRQTAIAEALEDAANRFGNVSTARVEAQSTGSMWIVELRRPDGSGLHYAISTENGAIRERRTFQ